MQQPPTRFGRAKFGGTQSTLITLSLAGGVILAAGAGVLVSSVRNSEDLSLNATIVALCLIPVSSIAVWALLVDRSTVKGGVGHPEDTIENIWYNQAAADTFHSCLILAGVLCFTSTLWDYSISGYWAALSLFGFLNAVFVLSYCLHRSKQS